MHGYPSCDSDFYTCMIVGVTPDNCTKNDLRLVNGSTNASGRVEICRQGCWGTVCDDSWDRDDATVACKQLGFINTSQRAIPTRGAYFGEGSGPIHLSNARCNTSESMSRLIDCNPIVIDRDGINNCSHSQDAGLICRGSYNLPSSLCRSPFIVV